MKIKANGKITKTTTKTYPILNFVLNFVNFVFTSTYISNSYHINLCIIPDKNNYF